MDNKKSIEAIEKKARKSYVRYAVIAPAVILVILTTTQVLFTDSFYKPGIRVFFLTLPVSIILSFFQAFNKNTSKKRQILTTLLFHIAIAAFIIFTAPLNSGYIFVWILLVYGIRVNINNSVTWFSYVALFCVQWLTLLYRDSLSLTNIFDLAITFSLIVIVSQLMIQAQAGEQHELHELKNSLDRENFERQRVLSLINSMGEAVVATDENGKVLLYNAATLNLLDTNNSLEGEPLDKYLHLKTDDGKSTKLFSLLKKDGIGLTSSDYLHEYAKDDAINLYINVAPIRLGFKEHTGSGYIVILRDITKQKSLEEERDEFISVVSHELRTPAAIAEGNISNAQFINKSKNDPKLTGESLEEAHKQVVFLANMINDLATLSRAERTDIEVEIAEINPAEILFSMQKDYLEQAESKKLKLTAGAAQDTKLIYTSELYLREIIQNFVTNAIKYTKKGTIIMHVRSNTKGDAVFSIADSGIGLSKVDQKRIFEKFFRSEDFRTRESNGTGLGLYVTSKLAHRLNAQISVESTLNKGSTFTITFPSMGKLGSRGIKKTNTIN